MSSSRCSANALFLRDLGRGRFREDSHKHSQKELLLHTLFFTELILLYTTGSGSRVLLVFCV